MSDMTAEEMDGLPPLEQPRLTDAELDEIIGPHDGCDECDIAGVAKGEYCHRCEGERAMAKELRELRARVVLLDALAGGNRLLFDEAAVLRVQNAELLDIRDVRVTMATIHRLEEQNAALRVATDEAQAAWASTAAVIEIVQEQNTKLKEDLSAAELRESVWMHGPNSAYELAQQNAKLVAALEANKEEATLRWTGQTKFAKAGFEAIIDTCDAVLASVKGEQG